MNVQFGERFRIQMKPVGENTPHLGPFSDFLGDHRTALNQSLVNALAAQGIRAGMSVRPVKHDQVLLINGRRHASVDHEQKFYEKAAAQLQEIVTEDVAARHNHEALAARLEELREMFRGFGDSVHGSARELATSVQASLSQLESVADAVKERGMTALLDPALVQAMRANLVSANTREGQIAQRAATRAAFRVAENPGCDLEPEPVILEYRLAEGRYELTNLDAVVEKVKTYV